MQIEKMKYHSPGWNVETQHRLYQLWGPGEITHDGYPTGARRDFWQAAWQDDRNELAGNFYKGDSLEDALAVFPKSVRNLFASATRDHYDE